MRESINITLGTVLGGPVRVHELAHRTIDLFGVQAARIHPYQQGPIESQRRKGISVGSALGRRLKWRVSTDFRMD
jgi:hypothetical protein